MHKKPVHKMRRYVLSRRKWKLRFVFWGGAITIGVVGAVFAMATLRADETFRQLYQLHPYITLAIPPIGLVVITFLTRSLFKGSEGSGIPQAIASLQMKRSQTRASILSLRVALGKALLTGGGLLSGASVGHQGPMVHIGASIMYSLRKIAPFRGNDMSRALILAGSAAGISAAFNTPLAGIMFAIEEMSRSFEERTSGTVLIAVILAGITALTILGKYTYFGTSAASTTLKESWPVIIICGTLGGFFGGICGSTLIYGMRRVSRFAQRQPMLLAFICGLLISLFGFISDGATFGTGYEHAKALINGETPTDPMFPVYKYGVTVISYLSGIPGGIFAPSLSIGAGMGANIAEFFPYIPLAVLVMLGMVGYFTGVVQTPITALIIVMEMTDNSSMLLPLMATALIAKGVSRWVCPTPIYQAMATHYTDIILNQNEKETSKSKP